MCIAREVQPLQVAEESASSGGVGALKGATENTQRTVLLSLLGSGFAGDFLEATRRLRRKVADLLGTMSKAPSHVSCPPAGLAKGLAF